MDADEIDDLEDFVVNIASITTLYLDVMAPDLDSAQPLNRDEDHIAMFAYYRQTMIDGTED